MTLRKVHVALDERSYEITIGAGLLAQAGELTRAALEAKTQRLAIISNPKVYGLYGKTMERNLHRAGFKTLTHLMGDGERAKSLRTAERAWSFLLENRCSRSDAVIALGGGVVGDLAGFVAASYQRGIPFVQIPTTLLAHIDSSVGGKTAVNHPLGKNMIGAFHQPRAVIIDPTVLHSLPLRELRAGLFEVIKTGIIRDRALFEFTRESLRQIQSLHADTLSHIIARCCEIKAEVVMADERESGLRRILNYGHTIGHALESVTKYRRLKHGEAVAYGMKSAAAIAEKAGILSAADCREIRSGIEAPGPLPRISDLSPADIYAALWHDKKVSQGRIPFILPVRIGEVIVRDDIPPQIIRAAIREMISA
jgi:3-dehydroquinate synthase